MLEYKKQEIIAIESVPAHTPDLTNTIVEIATSQSTGVLLGFVALPLIVYYWLGGNKLMEAYRTHKERDTASIEKIADSFQNLYMKQATDNTQIIKDVEEILEDIKDNQARLITIEQKLDRILSLSTSNK
jgi:hypothetical protein